MKNKTSFTNAKYLIVSNGIYSMRQAIWEGDVAALNASVNAWGKVAEYTEPKLKAVEIRADSSAIVAIQRKRFDGGVDAIEAEVVEVDPVVEAIINAAVEDEDEYEDEE